MPYRDRLRGQTTVRSALTGVNAAVVGILLAALYTPVWTSAVTGPLDMAMALTAFLLLALWKVRPWMIVLGGRSQHDLEDGVVSGTVVGGVVLRPVRPGRHDHVVGCSRRE